MGRRCVRSLREPLSVEPAAEVGQGGFLSATESWASGQCLRRWAKILQVDDKAPAGNDALTDEYPTRPPYVRREAACHQSKRV